MSNPNPPTEPQAPKHHKPPHKRPELHQNRLSPKQRRLIQAYADPNSPTHGNATRSAISAGYSEKGAGVTAHHALKSTNGERELNRIFDAAGITTEKLGKVVKQGLKAHYDQAFIHQKTGQIVYAKRRPDYNIRLKAARLAAEFRGDFAPKELDVRIALLAGRIQAARQREYEREPQQVVVEPDDKQTDDVTPIE